MSALPLDLPGSRAPVWLAHMRWHVVGGNVVALVVAQALGISLPLGVLIACVGAIALSNVALAAVIRRSKKSGALAMTLALAFDVSVLTFELARSGAGATALAHFYLVPTLLAGLLLSRRGAIAVTALAIVGFVLLSPHDVGRAVVFAILALFTGLITWRTAQASRTHHVDLLRKQRIAAHAEKLASLTTLAAGAAHELGSPLGTIAVVAEDLDTLIEEAPAQAMEDARIIREEVTRCREIVHRMNARAGQLLGEAPEPTTTGAILAGLDSHVRVVVRGDRDATLECPQRGLVRILGNLVRNALQASDAEVVVSAERVGERVRFIVEDRGTGIPEEVRSRLGEPFVTTKEPGNGMGLGLFLSFAFADLCAGRLELSARSGGGTSAVLELPRHARAAS